MRAAPTYFINFLYAFRLPPHRCACLLPSPCNLNLCTKLPQLPFEGACTQQSISCPFAAEGLQPPRGCSPQAASPATRKAKSQGRKAKEKKKKKSLRTHDMPSGKLQKAAATGSEDAISCALLWLGIGDGSGSGGSCFPGHPLGQEWRSDGWVQRGCCNPAHKGLAPRQNVLFPCKFCCFCWFKTGLRRYFNIVFL